MHYLDEVKKYYNNGDPSHDWSHIVRVVKTCKAFALELGADERILLAAAYLHDIVNIPKNSELRSQASRLAAQKASQLLENHDFSESEIARIVQVIKEHSYSANLPATSLESAILQDADKLDSMGAIGVMRWTTCGTKMNAKYYDLDDPWAQNRELDDKLYSLDHFEKKLMRLYDKLNTTPGKIEGEKRLKFFHDFLNHLKMEI